MRNAFLCLTLLAVLFAAVPQAGHAGAACCQFKDSCKAMDDPTKCKDDDGEFFLTAHCDGKTCILTAPSPIEPRPVGLGEAVCSGSLSSVPLPEAKAGGPVPSWCTNRNSSYCTYAWNWGTRCCYPSYISPGAFCPEVCE